MIRHKSTHIVAYAGTQDVLKSTTNTSTKTTDSKIDGLQQEYCDDFVCTSSPAIESSIKTMVLDGVGVWV